MHIDDPYDDPGEYYLVRELDTLPGIFGADELFEGMSKDCSRRPAARRGAIVQNFVYRDPGATVYFSKGGVS